jgi:hypothetical protein
MPFAFRIACAFTSVPEPGAPIETRLPRRSSSELMPLPSRATMWIMLAYIEARPRSISSCWPSNRPVPVCACCTVSASASARSASPVAMRPMFSTEAPVTSAVAL